MKTRVRDLVEQGDRLFERRRPLLSIWQTLAENFFPLRADFTASISLGQEFASHLMTGRPLLAHRDLGNALSSMLRPRGRPWFHARTGEESIDNETANKTWLDAKTAVMRKVMYNHRSGFVRATKQGDNDFIVFGQCVIEPTPTGDLNAALYRNWHLRDVAWCENAELRIERIDRNWKLEARQLVKLFGDKAAVAVKTAAENEPYREFKCRHIILPADHYDLNREDGKRINRKRFPFVSIYVDCDNDTILEEVPRRRLGYVIPRWLTLSGSQYAHSPAAVIALSDARMLQQINLTLLEAGQKAVDPPLKATREAIVGGVNVYAGGITWADAEYDERMGPAIERLMDVSPGLNWGEEREQKIIDLIQEAFFLNVLALPPPADGDKMTMYEASQRVEEYIRRALPLFEPMEVEYNGQLCEETFELCMDMGAFGPLDDMPPDLRGQEIRWQFESPLQAANERIKVSAFQQSMQLLSIAAAIDPAAQADFNVDKAFRAALSGVPGTQADWVPPEDEATRAKDAMRQAAMVAAQANAIGQGADVAAKVGTAAQQLQTGGVI